jgi:hypothetical protein
MVTRLTTPPYIPARAGVYNPARMLRRPVLLALLLVLGVSASTSAGEVSAFVGVSSPGETWARTLGGTFSTTWFQVLALEGELARTRGEREDDGMTSITGCALVAPPIGVFTPYAGLGIGAFRQTSVGATSARELSDHGVLRAFIVGVKLKLGLAVVRGEYRQINLGEEPLLPMDRRVSLGAGIRF